jgi:hypothetical protein
MFFFGIFGIESKEKELRFIQNVICKACSSMSTYRLIKVYNYFHFFFIPIFKWGEVYYVEARCCRAVFEIDKEVGRKLETGGDIPLTDADLRQAYTGSHSHGYANERVCHTCGRNVDSSYSYCPYCGNKMK